MRTLTRTAYALLKANPHAAVVPTGNPLGRTKKVKTSSSGASVNPKEGSGTTIYR